MGRNQRTPTLGGVGALEGVHVGTTNTQEIKPSLIDLQARFVSRRFALPMTLAAVIATLAFSTEAKR
jgi:hypothetical protein